VFCAVDDLIPVSGKPLTGFPEFLDTLSQMGISCVWVTFRNRHQLDSPIRRSGHSAPFIAEGGSAAYLPEDYFHLKPARTVRLGRFTCIPVARPQPAAAEALDWLAEETGVSVVPLRSLTARELAQNSGLSRPEAEALRQRDFDELFFFAGTSDADIQRFQERASHHKLSVRPSGAFWSLAVNASLPTCIQELRKLYDRALHSHVLAIALATSAASQDLEKSCDRAIFLLDRSATEDLRPPANRPAPKVIPLFSANAWSLVLETIQTRHF
jgi:predicted mannosyl-3-phosphoglycerate phosphatase (HAD superfamily)